MPTALGKCSRELSGGEGGFTLIELMISVGLMLVTALLLLQASIQVTRVFQETVAGTQAAGFQSDARIEQILRADAQTSQAAYIPATDMTGQPNAGTDVAFASQSDNGQAVAWGYHYDAESASLRRYAIAPPDSGGANGELVASHLPGFKAELLQASALIGSGNPYAPALSGAARGGAHALADRMMRLPIGDIRGGNGVVQVTLSTEKARRVVHLTTGTMPTGFSIVAAPTYHIVLWRHDTTHHGFLSTNTQAHIYARVSIRYTPEGPPLSWCDYYIGTFDGNPEGVWRSASPDANGWIPAREDPRKLFHACTTRSDGSAVPMPTAPPLRGVVRMIDSRSWER